MVGMNKTEAVQNLRRSNTARPIPSRKPEQRGGRGEQKRAAINEQRGT